MTVYDILFSFDGRIGRSTYWLYNIPIIFIYTLTGLLDLGVFSLIIWLLLLEPSIAIGVKRWHDRNKSGWWMLVTIIPIIGELWLIIECGLIKGTTGSNRFGEDPLKLEFVGV